MGLKRLAYKTPEVSLALWELRLTEFVEVKGVFTSDMFQQQMIFVDKLDFTSSLKSSLLGYNNRCPLYDRPSTPKKPDQTQSFMKASIRPQGNLNNSRSILSKKPPK